MIDTSRILNTDLAIKAIKSTGLPLTTSKVTHTNTRRGLSQVIERDAHRIHHCHGYTDVIAVQFITSYYYQGVAR